MLGKYDRAFYLQDTFKVAKQLLGSSLWTHLEGHLTGGMIVEVECYIGGIDKASHSYQGRRTPRTEIQFGPGGYAYIFLAYGLHAQFCVVSGPAGVSDVVLVRALEPVAGIDVMRQRRNQHRITNLTNGPGKLCQALAITTHAYGEDLCGERIWITCRQRYIDPRSIIESRRVGIEYAGEFADSRWRFFLGNSSFVSRRRVPELADS